MEEILIPSIMHSKLYLVGFFLTLLVAVPISYARINKYASVSKNKALQNYAMPLLISSLVIFGTIITPHFHTINNLALILPMVWFMVFQANVEYHFFSFSRGAFLAIAGLSLLYAYFNGYEQYDIFVALFASLMLVLIYKISPKRKNYINKIANPYAVFAIIVTLGLDNMGTFLFFFLKSMAAFYFLRILFYMIKSTRGNFTSNHILAKFLEFTKFHFMAWFLTMLEINSHIYQSL